MKHEDSFLKPSKRKETCVGQHGSVDQREIRKDLNDADESCDFYDPYESYITYEIFVNRLIIEIIEFFCIYFFHLLWYAFSESKERSYSRGIA